MKITRRRRSLLRISRSRRAADICSLDGLLRGSLETVTNAAGAIIEYRLSRSTRLRPLDCGAKRLHDRADGCRHCRVNGSSKTVLGASAGSLHGRADCALSDTKLSGAGEELDHGGQWLGPGGTGRL